MQFKDYYEVLGVPRAASEDEIKRAYRKLARKFHPDVSKLGDAEIRFKELGEAYAVLKSPEKRSAYDQLGKDWKTGQEFKPPPDWDTGFEFSGRNGGREQDFSEFFEGLFGRHSAPNQHAGRPAAGRDHHARIAIDLTDTYRGAQRSITLRLPTVDAQGQVSLMERKLDVLIPKGIRSGQHLRLAGQGEPSYGATAGSTAGDLYLEISIKPHHLFRVEGRDVYLTLPIAPWEAALGDSVTAPTPDGPVNITIPANSAAGKQLRLRGRGIPGKPPGDLFVILAIALPPADTESARAAYQTMAQAFTFNPRSSLEG